jgi:uncharacterized protein YpmB
MSKSKSRQPSRQASAASKSGSSGTTRMSANLSKTTTKVAVEDAPESTDKAEVTTTTAEVTSSNNAVDETSESAEKEGSTDKATKVLASKATSKIAEDEASESAKKEAPVAKTVKAAPATSGKLAPAKVAAKSVPNTPPLRPVPNTPVGVGGKAQSRDAAKYERRQVERQMRYLAERRRRRNRIVTILSIVLVLVILGGAGYFVYHQSTTPSTAASKAAQGSYQEAIFNSTYPPVESVYCDQLEQSIEHIHVYVSMYINGQASPLPASIGIPQDSSGNATCFYWLHTHDTSGVIHIESPSTEIFTFGQFRDEWDQQFVSLGFPPELLLNGWKIWINGKVYNGSLASVPFDAHNIITLAYNSPNVKPVKTYNWGSL